MRWSKLPFYCSDICIRPLSETRPQMICGFIIITNALNGSATQCTALEIDFDNCIVFCIWIYITGHILIYKNYYIIRPLSIKCYAGYVALMLIRYCLLIGLALLHCNEVFLGISIHLELFWNDGHNLPQHTKRSTKQPVQNPLVL